MSTKKPRPEKSIKDAYFAGEMSAKELLKQLERSPEGDRQRRSIEEKAKKLSTHLEKLLA